MSWYKSFCLIMLEFTNQSHNNSVKTLFSSPLNKNFYTFEWKLPSAGQSTSNILGLAGQQKALLSLPVMLLTIPLLLRSVSPADSSLLKDIEGRKKINLMIRPSFFLLSHPFPQGSNCSFLKDILTHPGTTFCLHVYVQLRYHRSVWL